MARDQVIFDRTVREALRRAALLFAPRTGHASASEPGLVPLSPGDATQFLNGASTPAFAPVKGSDLSLSDVTTNDVSITKHGFAPKAPNDTSKFLRGDGRWAASGGGGAVWATEDSRTPPGSANALDDEFEGTDGAAIDAAWTAVNQGTSTAVLDGLGRAILTAQVLSTNSHRHWVKSAPATPWSVTTRVSIVNNVTSPQTGLVVRNSSTGKFIVFGPVCFGTGTYDIGLYRFNSPTSFSATLAQNALAAMAVPVYLTITNDGTTLKFYQSFVGTHTKHRILVGSDPIASFVVTADQIGIDVDSQNASTAGVGAFEFFRVGA